ncbi:MAG: hypothetical protein AABX51_04200 [Nanoarchaeota archaeon]
MNKKGIELTLNTIVIAIIVLVVLAVMLIVFAGVFTRGGTKPLDCVTRALSEDNDNDKVKDAVDPCPCDDNVPRECAQPADARPAGCPGSGSACPQGDTCLPEQCQSKKNTP